MRDGLASLSHSLSSQTISHQKVREGLADVITIADQLDHQPVIARQFDHVLTYCSYFCEPWTCAVFHDRFPDFMEEIREHLATPMVRNKGGRGGRGQVWQWREVALFPPGSFSITCYTAMRRWGPRNEVRVRRG